MATQTKADLYKQIADLTGKLRGSIADANRHFNRCKILEIENRELKLILREHNITYTSHVNTLASNSTKAEFLKLAAEHGYSNVRIHGGRFEIRDENRDWNEVTA